MLRVMHRNERHFANANRFIPSAFVKNKCTKRSNYMRLHLKAENRIDENMSSPFLSISLARASEEGGRAAERGERRRKLKRMHVCNLPFSVSRAAQTLN